MAEYFDTRDEAERLIQDRYAKDSKPPLLLAKIFNNDAEKWIVDYDPRRNPSASPAIKLPENHSAEPPDRDRRSRSTPLHPTIAGRRCCGCGTSEGKE